MFHNFLKAHTQMLTADEIPAKVKQASFMWERGAKLQYTEPSPVNAAENAVYWGNTLLKQVPRPPFVQNREEYLPALP